MSGRLSTWAAAMVVARRDFTAILFSRSFFFFLLGPLFPVVIGAMAGGVGQHVQQSAERPVLGVAMSPADVARMQAARTALKEWSEIAVIDLQPVALPDDPAKFDARAVLDAKAVGAVVGGTPQAPILTAPAGDIAGWRRPVALLAAQATGRGVDSFPTVALAPVAHAKAADNRHGRMLTAQAAQTLLFLLTMLLAGMVLSNLVEEKGNKIIEILAAAVPMDAVFFGKLFAMLAVSMVGIGVWGLAGGGFALAAGHALPSLAAPAVGWPLFFMLGVVYFAMAYLLLGSIFLSIGSMAATVREVQTLSMPVTMMQLMVFFLASYAMTQPGSPIEIAAVVFPFSSPFAMLARAAQEPALWPHAAALGWQALAVIVCVRGGARLFRSRVMKSGPAGGGKPKRGLFVRTKPATA